MNRADLYRLHKTLCDQAITLMRVKNRDYGENSDPFRNFRTHGLYGILVRLHDKLARLQTFCETGTLAVKSEPVHDAVLDIINYAVLFEGYNVDGKRSDQGNLPQPTAARPVDPRLISRLANSRAGDAGGDSRGARRAERPAPGYRVPVQVAPPSRGTGAGRGRRKPVGNKHRRRKGKV